MSKKEFDDFLEKEEQRIKPTVDWEKEMIDWFASHLDKLFSDIEAWLKEYVDAKKIKLEFNKIEVYEEALGVYMVRNLKIVIGNKIAKLTPYGTILIGPPGRADLSSGAETIRFILADKNATGPKIVSSVFESEEELRKYKEDEKNKPKPQIDWVWKITSDPPNIKYTELNQDSFLHCLKEVVDA